MAIRSGQPIPDRIANAPKLMFGSDLYLQVYVDLCSDRDTRITWQEIVNYGTFYELDKETIEDLTYVIRIVFNNVNPKKE